MHSNQTDQFFFETSSEIKSSDTSSTSNTQSPPKPRLETTNNEVSLSKTTSPVIKTQTSVKQTTPKPTTMPLATTTITSDWRPESSTIFSTANPVSALYVKSKAILINIVGQIPACWNLNANLALNIKKELEAQFRNVTNFEKIEIMKISSDR